MRNFFLLFFLFCISLKAQDSLPQVILLDEVQISVVDTGFTVSDFIAIVKEDTSFYMGFKHLRYYSHRFQSELSIFNKKGREIGNLKREGLHNVINDTAWVLTEYKQDSGKIYKRNGKYKYYTPEAFDEVFFPADSIPVSLTISKKKSDKQSKNMRDAKTVGFSIGSNETEQKKGGLSKKLAIFDISMQQYYNYLIGETYYNGIDCYTFTCMVKDTLTEREKKGALIRKLVSYFDKRNFKVLYREYIFYYDHLLFDLDMQVIVDMEYVNQVHVPTKIYYKGYWNVFMIKPERAEFIIRLEDYQIPESNLLELN